jgi:hypothetical protein
VSKRSNVPRRLEQHQEVDFPYGVIDKFLEYSPFLFSDAARRAALKLRNALRDVHVGALLRAEVQVPFVFDLASLDRTLRFAWGRVADSFEEHGHDPEARRKLAACHEALGGLMVSLGISRKHSRGAAAA